MKKNIRSIAILAALAVVLAVGVMAQQKSADTAVDPVCGMAIAKAKAAATFDYKGTTYYFCNAADKDAFVKDPEKYLQAAAKPQAGQMGHMTGEGQAGMMMPHAQGAGQPGACPMMQGGMGGGMMQGMGQGMGQGMSGCPMMGQGQPGMMRGHMGMQGRGMMGAQGMGMLFRLYGDKLDVAVENTKDGAVLRFTSKDPEVVKAIQVHLAEHLAMMKKMQEAAKTPATGGAPAKESGASCCDSGCPIKK